MSGIQTYALSFTEVKRFRLFAFDFAISLKNLRLIKALLSGDILTTSFDWHASNVMTVISKKKKK